MKKKHRISFFGSCLGKPGEPYYDAMEQAGELIAQRGFIVVTGANSGLGMEAPAKGARNLGGHTIGYAIRGLGRVNEFIVERYFCGWRWQSTSVKIGIRLGRLMDSDGFIMAIGKEGTFSELAQFIDLSAKFRSHGRTKRLAILSLPEAPNPIDKDLLLYLQQKGLLSLKVLDAIRIYETPEDAVNWVTLGWASRNWSAQK